MDFKRTTISLRENTLRALKRLALEKNSSLIEVTNDALDLGLRELGERRSRREVFRKIDRIRREMARYKINAEEIYRVSKSQLR